MSVFAVDDFDAIRLRMLELRAEKERAGKRCRHCLQSFGAQHELGCTFTSTVVETECGE